MALSVKKGSFNAPTATGNSAVTGVGFQPKALILWATNNVVAGYLDQQSVAVGFVQSTTARKAIAGCSDDAAGVQNSNTGKRLADLAITILSAGTPTVGAEADFVSFDADGFTLNWTTAGAGKDYIVHYLALGGADLTNVFVGAITCPTSAGSQGVTGVGFRPDAVILGSTMQTTVASAAELTFGLGMGVSATSHGTSSIDDRDNVGTTTSACRQITTKLLALTSAGGSLQREGDLTSMDADGFTINWTTGTVAHLVPFIALKGPQFKVGAETQRASIGTKATTGVGFEPKALLAMSTCRIASGSTDATTERLTIGGADGTTEGCTWVSSADAVTTPNSESATVIDKFLRFATLPATTNAEADLTVLGADGFTLDWTTADATIREFIYLAIGDAPPAVPDVGSGGLSGDRVCASYYYHWI